MDAHKQAERTRDTLAPSGFNQRVGAVLRFVQQQVGGEVIVGLAITNVVLWVLLRPPGVPGTMYLGEIFATTAIVLLSCSLSRLAVVGPSSPRMSTCAVPVG